jgi:simple sugar transport system substrate-binding protein
VYLGFELAGSVPEILAHMNKQLNYSDLQKGFATLLFLLGFGCMIAEAQDTKLKLAFITCARDAQFFIPVKKGMNEAAEMMGVCCEWLGTEGVDLAAQAKFLQQAVKDGYDGVAFNIIDPEAFDEVIQEAIDAGVPVVGFNVDDHATPNARLSSVNQRLYEAGKSLGQHVFSHIPDGSQVLLTKHDEGVSALDDRARGIQDALRGKDIQWQILITGNDAVEGAGVVAETLEANPDIRLVLNTGQADTEATGRALEAMVKSTTCWTAGFDLSPKTLQLIQDGYIFCAIDQQPYIQGFYPVVQLTHYLRFGIMPSDMDAGAAIVDQTNVDQVMELVKQQYR